MTVALHRTLAQAQRDLALCAATVPSGWRLAIRPVDPPMVPTPRCRVDALIALLHLSLEVDKFKARVQAIDLDAPDIELLQQAIDTLTGIQHAIPVGAPC